MRSLIGVSVLGLIVCQIWISVDFIASTASIFNLLTLSLDRYWSITSPLQYLGKRTRTRALFLVGFAWGLSLLWVIPIVGWHKLNGGKRQIPVGNRVLGIRTECQESRRA